MPALETTTIVIGAIGLIGGAMIGPIAGDLWRKIKGSEYATKSDCKARHEVMRRDCQACKAATQSSICAIQHESLKTMKLLRIIAIHVNVPRDQLDEFL